MHLTELLSSFPSYNPTPVTVQTCSLSVSKRIVGFRLKGFIVWIRNSESRSQTNYSTLQNNLRISNCYLTRFLLEFAMMVYEQLSLEERKQHTFLEIGYVNQHLDFTC